MNIQLLIEIAYLFIVFLVCLRIIYETNTSAKTLSYLLLVVFIPIIGIIVYFSLGNDYRKNKIYSKKLIKNEHLFERIKEQLQWSSRAILDQNNEPALINNPQLSHLLLLDGSPLTVNNEAKLLINGEQTFPEIKKALLNAKHHIHLEYYIYEDDNIGNEIKDILILKAKEGVSVRFIYDDFGSSDIRKKFSDELRQHGIEVFPFYKITFIKLANRINYRNHRKIIVIDGETSFVGGINVSDKYINPNPEQLYWRDTHMMIKGPGTRFLQYTFLCDWNFCSGQNITIESEFFNDKQIGTGHTTLQIASSGPDSDRPTILYALLQAIGKARKEILITSPYFIPDESLIDALKIASLSGVAIKLIVPDRADSFFVNAAACSYYSDLLAAGVEIYLYNKGFIHSKSMVIDNELSVLGTANMDVRSFELNFEVNAIIYSSSFSEELRHLFYSDMLNCTAIDAVAWDLRPNWKTLPEKIARLFSPLL